ncbi:hypothetical protein PZA11_002464 [Diplocarpon coronariae]|uniref:L-dopachrome isomerase n=1 Tax=Diplocarpon coronariae TaxID=2795749 RepID=A0A218YV23_9HELO|nr:hypothetical protein JHW43_001701 [Diplocarpon mali]OWO98745.1 hypothetical protein B2J93_8497 [Marssonina coronariae]
MPGTFRTIDVTSQRYDPDIDAVLINKKLRRQSYLASPSPKIIQLPPSPAESENDAVMHETSPRASPSATNSSSATTREERRITRHMDRGTPGDGPIFSDTAASERKDLAKRKSQYYGDVFAYREPKSSARERVTKESMVVADVRTNVIVHDEYTFITDLSYYLSQRYQRPENSIVVSLAHSCCMLFGGNFDPAYTLNITALPCQLQPVTNKRNAALLAVHMEEAIGVIARRGVIKFVAIAEENLANDGKTVSGEIEELERETTENNVNTHHSLSKGASKSRRRQSVRSLRGMNAMSTHNESGPSTPPPTSNGLRNGTENGDTTAPAPELTGRKSDFNRKAEKVQKMSRRKSFIATIFGKTA